MKKKLLILFVLTATFLSCTFAAYAADPTLPVIVVPTIKTTTNVDVTINVGGLTVTTGTPETGIITRTYDEQGNTVSTTTISPTGKTTTTTATSLDGVIGTWDDVGEFTSADSLKGVTGFWNNFGEYILVQPK
jgi:hypothetical protein